MSIYAWFEYAYYDGLLTFSKLLVQCDDKRIKSWSVQWLGSAAEGRDG